MKIAAVISEYNPFHNGHRYQLKSLKERYDGVLVIMSASFVQRGEAAIRDKWTRAKTALLNGADLVIELPVEFSLSSAEKFALGGVELAEKTGVCSALCFGSEEGDILPFLSAADLMNNEPPEVSEKILSALKSGKSYPAARSHGYRGMIKDELLTRPNNILGIEYVRAIKKIDSALRPETIKRIGSGHDDTDYSGEYACASFIRQLMVQKKDYRRFLPENTWEILENGLTFDTERLTPLLKYTILTKNKDFLAEINDVSEGLENKILRSVRTKENFSEIAADIKSKRYTLSRIRRILVSAVLGIDKQYRSPEYIRVLGMTGVGREILRQMKKSAALPIVTKAADFSSPMFLRNVFATDVAHLCSDRPVCGADYRISPIITDK